MSKPAPSANSAYFFCPPSLEPTLTDERCAIVECLNTTGDADVSLARAIVAPGVTTQLHSLTITERYVVESGQGLMEVAGTDVFAIGPGDCVLIPPGVSQRVRNLGDSELSFLCVCTPRFEPSHYINLEDDSTPELTVDA